MARIRSAVADVWKPRKLGEVCRVVGGSTPMSGVADYWNGDICWITPTDLGKLRGTHIYSSQRRITEAGFRSCNVELVPPGSVILSSRAPIGHLGIAEMRLCTNQGCKSFVPGPEVDSLFLYFALKQAVPTLQALGSGTTFKELPKAILERFELAFPPLHEQQRIAARLSEQMKIIEHARRISEDQVAAAKAFRAAHIREVFQSQMARSWPIEKVGNIASLIIDGPHVTPSYVATGIPFVTVRNIVNRRLDFSETRFVTEADHDEFKRRGHAEAGDILYTKDGTLGIPCVVDTDREFSFFVSVALIKPRRNLVNPYFLALALESPDVLKQVEFLGAGAGLKHMVLKSIRALEVRFPPLLQQERLAVQLKEKIRESERLHMAAKDQLRAIGRLPSMLLNDAFVRNAYKNALH